MSDKMKKQTIINSKGRPYSFEYENNLNKDHEYE